jgi:DNA-binding NtrC family response regulator
VRELENYVEHLLIMGQEEAQADFLRAYISGPRPESRNGPSACHTRVETPLVEMGFGSKGRALTDPVASPNAATLPIRPTLQAAFGPTVPWPTLADVEREHIQKTLEHAGYNQTVAAKLLAIDRQQLIRKIKLYSLDLPIHRGRPRSQPLD